MKEIITERCFFEVKKEKNYLKRMTRKYNHQRKRNEVKDDGKTNSSKFWLRTPNNKRYHNIFSIQKIIENLNGFEKCEILKTTEEIDTLSDFQRRLWKKELLSQENKKKTHSLLLILLFYYNF